MLLYSIVVIAIIALSSIAFTYILHRHKPVDANTFIVIVFSSLFVLVLSLCFPFLFAAIINLASRTENTLRVIVGFSVILLIYLMAIFRFAHFIFMFLSENKSARLQGFVEKVNEEGLSNYFLHIMKLRRKQLSAIGRNGEVSAVLAKNTGGGVVLESIQPQESGPVNNNEQIEASVEETITMTAEQQEEVTDELPEQPIDIVNEAINIINDESNAMDEETKPAAGIPEEIMKTLEEAASNDENVVSEFDEYIKVASQSMNHSAEAAASEICSEVENDNYEELNIENENVKEESDIITSNEVYEEIQDMNTEIPETISTLDETSVIEEQEPAEVILESDEVIISNKEDYLEDKNESVLDQQAEVMEKEEKILTSQASIDSYIDEAFKLKQEGDYESAIIYYMYALDSKPEDSLVFWIILDICVLYKEMGQIELAKQILESYVELYGSVMDQQVKDEIVRNLTEE